MDAGGEFSYIANQPWRVRTESKEEGEWEEAAKQEEAYKKEEGIIVLKNL